MAIRISAISAAPQSTIGRVQPLPADFDPASPVQTALNLRLSETSGIGTRSTLSGLGELVQVVT